MSLKAGLRVALTMLHCIQIRTNHSLLEPPHSENCSTDGLIPASISTIQSCRTEYGGTYVAIMNAEVAVNTTHVRECEIITMAFGYEMLDNRLTRATGLI